jgi:hypothetical protein
MSQNAHILAECFCIIAQQSNSTDAPLLPKTWHFQAKRYFDSVRYDRKSAQPFFLTITLAISVDDLILLSTLIRFYTSPQLPDLAQSSADITKKGCKYYTIDR